MVQAAGADPLADREAETTMSDASVGGKPGFNLPISGFLSPKELGDFLKRGDIALAMGILTILVVLIVPLPPLLLDMLLAVSIILSVLILMTSLFILAPLDFSSFPTVLLIATMLRLSLNLASTRLILSHGHTGGSAAGHVIEGFANFIMGGSVFLGLVIFAVLLIVNFIVITKGAGRMAEVSARFALDAMPGKQLAIDSDMAAGAITHEQARERRRIEQEETTFFGSLDGADDSTICGLLAGSPLPGSVSPVAHADSTMRSRTRGDIARHYRMVRGAADDARAASAWPSGRPLRRRGA